MSRAKRSMTAIYIGSIMLLVGSYPFMDTELESSHAFEALWHLWLFAGAAAFVFGAERIRRNLRRLQS